MMEIVCRKISTPGETLLNPAASGWAKHKPLTIGLLPTPIEIVEEKSPYLAKTTGDHGHIKAIDVAAVHDEQSVWLRLSWVDPTKNDRLTDLDKFSDAVAVLFSLSADALAVTMGAPGAPVNAWYRQLHRNAAYDVIAEGFGSSVRRPGKETGLLSQGAYADGRWSLVFQRPLVLNGQQAINFAAGRKVDIAFAVWDGGNAERSGKKAFSGDFINMRL